MKTELTIDELGELYDLADAYADRFDEDPDDCELFEGLRDKLGQMIKELKGESK